MAEMMSKYLKKLLFYIYAALFLAIWVRLYLVQVRYHDLYSHYTEKQYRRVIKVEPYRGKILTRDGTVLAESLQVYSLYADPKQYWSFYRDNSPQELARVVGVKNIHKILSRRDVRFVWIKRRLTDREVQEVKQLSKKVISEGKKRGTLIPWFRLQKEFIRFYPEGELAGQVVGITGFSTGNRYDGRGIAGIEATYNEFLKGKEETIVVTRDGSRLRRIMTSRIFLPERLNGLDVYTTIDASLQDVVEEYLSEGVKRAGGKRGMAVVMDPHTGRILAMASYPFFNPNKRDRRNLKYMKNLVISYGFEPGSVMKPFIVAGALDDGKLSLHERFYAEEGRYLFGGIVIHDHEKYGWLSVPEIIKYSSNIGMTKIGDKLGPEEVYRILRKFGFGMKTGIDLWGENPGYLRHWKNWYPADLANISFGQGLKVTLIQLVTAMSVIANGGLLVRPYVVDRVVDSSGNIVYKNDPEIKGRVISEETARIMRRVLHLVTEKGGTGTEAALPEVSVAGKTGTAQKWVGEYTREVYTASFVGFLPSNDPEWVLGIVVDEPEKEIYGGTAAAPIFREIARELIIRSGKLTLR